MGENLTGENYNKRYAGAIENVSGMMVAEKFLLNIYPQPVDNLWITYVYLVDKGFSPIIFVIKSRQ